MSLPAGGRAGFHSLVNHANRKHPRKTDPTVPSSAAKLECIRARLAATPISPGVPCACQAQSAFIQCPAARVLRLRTGFSLSRERGRENWAFFRRSAHSDDAVLRHRRIPRGLRAAAKAAFGEQIEVHLFEPIAGKPRADSKSIELITDFRKLRAIPSAVAVGLVGEGDLRSTESRSTCCDDGACL